MFGTERPSWVSRIDRNPCGPALTWRKLGAKAIGRRELENYYDYDLSESKPVER